MIGSIVVVVGGEIVVCENSESPVSDVRENTVWLSEDEDCDTIALSVTAWLDCEEDVSIISDTCSTHLPASKLPD